MILIFFKLEFVYYLIHRRGSMDILSKYEKRLEFPEEKAQLNLIEKVGILDYRTEKLCSLELMACRLEYSVEVLLNKTDLTGGEKGKRKKNVKDLQAEASCKRSIEEASGSSIARKTEATLEKWFECHSNDPRL